MQKKIVGKKSGALLTALLFTAAFLISSAGFLVGTLKVQEKPAAAAELCILSQAQYAAIPDMAALRNVLGNCTVIFDFAQATRQCPSNTEPKLIGNNASDGTNYVCVYKSAETPGPAPVTPTPNGTICPVGKNGVSMVYDGTRCLGPVQRNNTDCSNWPNSIYQAETTKQDNGYDSGQCTTRPVSLSPPAGMACPKGNDGATMTYDYSTQLCHGKPKGTSCANFPGSTYEAGVDTPSGTRPGVCTAALVSTSNTTEEEPTLACETSLFNPLTWLVCPAVAAAQAAVQALDSGINSLMNIKTDKGSAFDTSGKIGQSYQKAWNTFRILSTAIIVIAGLAMIIAQAAGVEFLDAYTIRKTLPRLLVAAIFITLSWYLVGFLIQLSNDLGNSLRAVIYSPFAKAFPNSTITLDSSSLLVANLVGGAALYSVGLLGLGLFAIGALIAVFTGFIVLIVRKLIILLLIIVAPLAIACYVLPNTEKFWKFWKDTLISMLVVFPIIATFIAVGRVFAVIAYNSGGAAVTDPGSTLHGFAVLAHQLGFAQGTASPGLLPTIEAFIAYFLPYMLMKQAFDLAGGVISTVTGGASRATSGFQKWKTNKQEARSQRRAEKRAGRRAAWAAGNRFKGNTSVGNFLNAAGRNVANVRNAGFRPDRMRSRMQAAASTHEQQELAEYMEKNAAFNAIKGNDDYLQATMKNMGGGENESDWRRYLYNQGYRGRSLEQGVAQIRAAKRATSNEVFQRAAVMANAATGTGWKEGGAGQMMQSINEAAGNDRHAAASMLAQMRGSAAQSGRLDLAGSGFGTQVAALEKMHTGEMSAQQANEAVAKGALFTKDPGAFARARGQAVQNLAPHMLKSLEHAHQGVDLARRSGNQQAIYESERALAQEYAALDNLHTTLSHTAPENARIIADSVLAQQIQGSDGRTMTVMDQIRAYQANKNTIGGRAFDETTKTYGGVEAAAREGTPPDPDA